MQGILGVLRIEDDGVSHLYRILFTDGEEENTVAGVVDLFRPVPGEESFHLLKVVELEKADVDDRQVTLIQHG